MSDFMLTLADLESYPDRFHLIDVRDAKDYATAHVTGAVHTPLSELEARVGELPAGRIPVTICGKGGGRSDQGAALLRSLGHTDALWLEGGTNGWLAHNPDIRILIGGEPK